MSPESKRLLQRMKSESRLRPDLLSTLLTAASFFLKRSMRSSRCKPLAQPPPELSSQLSTSVTESQSFMLPMISALLNSLMSTSLWKKDLKSSRRSELFQSSLLCFLSARARTLSTSLDTWPQSQLLRLLRRRSSRNSLRNRPTEKSQ